MLLRQIDRIRRATRIDRLVVATSVEADDDRIEHICRAEGVPVSRGALNDVLDRFYQTARSEECDHVVRLTGDCPLSDPAVIDRVISRHIEGAFDYTSNSVPPTFPDGLDCESMTFAALETAWREAKLPSDREHVTPFLYHHPDRFRIGHVASVENLSSLRWTVDEPEDFAVISAVFEELLPLKSDFDMDDVLKLLRARPEIFKANSAFLRNEGYHRSLKADVVSPEEI